VHEEMPSGESLRLGARRVHKKSAGDAWGRKKKPTPVAGIARKISRRLHSSSPRIADTTGGGGTRVRRRIANMPKKKKRTLWRPGRRRRRYSKIATEPNGRKGEILKRDDCVDSSTAHDLLWGAAEPQREYKAALLKSYGSMGGRPSSQERLGNGVGPS